MTVALTDQKYNSRVTVGVFLTYNDEVTTTAATNEVQTATISGTPTGGTFTLSYKNFTTSAIAYNATAATVKTALEALDSIPAGTITVSGGAGGPYVVTFVGTAAGTDVPTIAATGSFTGGTSPSIAVVVTTPGVAAEPRLIELDLDPTGVQMAPNEIVLATEGLNDVFEENRRDKEILTVDMKRFQRALLIAAYQANPTPTAGIAEEYFDDGTYLTRHYGLKIVQTATRTDGGQKIEIHKIYPQTSIKRLDINQGGVTRQSVAASQLELNAIKTTTDLFGNAIPNVPTNGTYSIIRVIEL